MSDCKYRVYLDQTYFDSLDGIDYYYDKSNFFAHGAQKFFTIYQILRSGDFELTIVEESSGIKLTFKDSAKFKDWVKQNYEAFAEYLEKFYDGGHPESKLR